MSQLRPQLSLELLETRETPGVLTTESFDTVTPPALPSGWTTWASNGSIAFTTAAGLGVNGTDALVSNGSSTTSAMAMYPQAVSGDTGAAVSMYVNSLVPVYVFARGTNLNDPSSKSYLAVEVTRGLNVELLEVKGSLAHVLGNVSSSNSGYVSGDWIRVSLLPTGSTVKVEVSRQDTGQYLNSSGTWQTTETAVITATTSLPSTQGDVGVGRNAIYAGAVSFDDFSVIDSTSSPPVVPPPPPPQHRLRLRHPLPRRHLRQ